jgi:hypothetical protein
MANWVRTVAQRFNQDGPASLEDRGHRIPGHVSLLSAAQCAVLAAALQYPRPMGEWTWPTAAWMATALGHRVRAEKGWEMRQRPGLMPTVPRVRHAKVGAKLRRLLKDPPAGGPGVPTRLRPPQSDARLTNILSG